MAWIELHQSLTTHKKTRRLARKLGFGVPDGIPIVIGHLCMFWLWCVDGADGGSLADLDAQDIADAAGWTGDPELFTTAMIDAGFIDLDDNGCKRIHDWDDYIGRLISYRERERVQNRERAKRHRDKIKAAQEAERTETESQTPNTETITSPDGDITADTGWQQVVAAYETNIGMLPMGRAGDTLMSYYDDLGAEVTCKAIEITNLAQPSEPFKYLKAILEKWVKEGINTPEKAEAYTKQFNLRSKRQQPQPHTNEPPAVPLKFY